MGKGQLALRFPYTPALTGVDFLSHPGNARALEFLGAGASWPGGRLSLWGGPGTGKSHLLHIWAAEHGAELLPAAELREPFWPQRPVAIDDLDHAASEPALLHLLNAAAEAGQPVLLASRNPPGRLPTLLPDLASRLRAITAVEIGPADDAFLATLLQRLLADRQLSVKADIQSWLLTQLPRTPAALREAVARLDEAQLAAQLSVTRPLAMSALAELLAP